MDGRSREEGKGWGEPRDWKGEKSVGEEGSGGKA